MPTVGPMQLVIVLIIALLVFGPKRLPELGQSIGAGLRSFKDSVAGGDDDSVAGGDDDAELSRPEEHERGPE